MDKAIEEFLAEKKAKRIKGKLKSNISEQEKLLIEQEAEDEFLLENWLPKAAKRAGQLSLTSHPAKFSHPDAKSSYVLFEGEYAADGLLCSSNVPTEPDIVGSASALDVWKFLSIQVDDDRTIFEHLEECSDKIKNDFNIASASFNELRDGFLAIKKCESAKLTDAKIKQVYFPINNEHCVQEYHLLSILSPSGLIYKLRANINAIHFSDETKQARNDEKNNSYNKGGYDTLRDLSVIHYGGAQPQNISVLNSRYTGKAYLLPSVPPAINKKYLKFPKKDFFTDSLWRKDFSDEFKALHKIFSTDYNNVGIRDGRDKWLQAIIEKVIYKMLLIRSIEDSWAKDNCQLPLHQKIWLDNTFQEQREQKADWLKEVINDFARWIIRAYKKELDKKAQMLTDKDLQHIKKIVEQNEEGLK